MSTKYYFQLEEIDTSFKKSLTELRFNKSKEEESTDVDYEEPTPSVKIVDKKSSTFANGRKAISMNVDQMDRHEMSDYDEPPNYDEPPEVPFKQSAKKMQLKIPDQHEYEDYDEPVHHSQLISAEKI